MALKYFEQDFDYDFYPLRADRCTYEVLPAAPVSVYLYDGKPSEEDAAVGAASSGYTLIETVVAWSDTEDGQGKRISFAAVVEPSSVTSRFTDYYVAINTALTNPIPPVIKKIKFSRITGQESIIDVSISDVLSLEPQIELFCNKQGKCVGEVERYVDSAIKELKISITDCDRDYSNLTNPGQLNVAVAQHAVSKFFFGQSRDVGDIHWANGLRYKEEYKESLTKIHIELDGDGDGIEDSTRSSSGGIISLRVRR